MFFDIQKNNKNQIHKIAAYSQLFRQLVETFIHTMNLYKHNT